MADPRLTLMPRAGFAERTLEQKNVYLQDFAERFSAAHGRDHHTLDKTALSRLRRYYARRVWADLKLADAPDNEMNRVLRRLGEAIRDEDVRADVSAALLQDLPPKRVLRAAPEDDAQLMFFVPAVYDAPIKDDVNLMDVALFSLGKTARTGVIRYELKDSLITVEGGAEVGLATVFDYDIFLNMISYLAEEVRRYRIDAEKGPAPACRPRSTGPAPPTSSSFAAAPAVAANTKKSRPRSAASPRPPSASPTWPAASAARLIRGPSSGNTGWSAKPARVRWTRSKSRSRIGFI